MRSQLRDLETALDAIERKIAIYGGAAPLRIDERTDERIDERIK